MITTHIDNYFTENVNDETPTTTLWVAHKAVLRGHLISLTANKNKRLTKIKSLTRDLNNLYNKIQHNPSQNLTKPIQEKRSALDLILSANTEKSLRFSKAKFLFT